MRHKTLRAAAGSAALALAGAVALALPAHADTVTASTAPPLRFVSYNICGHECGDQLEGYDDEKRIDTVVAQASVSTWNADQIFLQEVCRPQYDKILARLGPLGFKGMYSATLTGADPSCAGADYGNAVFVRGPVTETLELDLTVGGEVEPVKVPCVRNYIQNRVNWACSVHLYWRDPSIRLLEAKKLAAQAKTWQDQGIPVVLGGDFNAGPRTAPLSEFYDPGVDDGAHGTFIEADETDTEFFDPAACAVGTDPRCRSGEPTREDKKLDYLFFSSKHFQSPVGDVLPPDSVVSDHRMVRGAASWADCATFAPATGALFRRDSSGALFRYTARGDGTLAAACKTGSGWSGMKEVVRLPGTTTLAALDGNGTLWHYPADASHAYTGATRVQAATGWSPHDLLVSPGDFSGDGTADLITRDAGGDLWLHTGSGGSAYAAPVKIGNSWNIYDLLFSPGDFSGDGKTDLLGRDSVGDLYLYKGNGSGGYAPRLKVASGLAGYDAMTHPGDVNSDGKADLLARDTAGGLFLLKGNGTGGFAAPVKAGTGYPAGELLF
ncbi:VCBS repeat-containing protein [Streptomyces sp. ISL-43]|uniref:FG-GAP-like repeat-containing protein n=1 Tax=Streptomyces sp. ISL-43 TaxID=2819183 RepID=UPI001BEA0731|nr:FG-GAP-like repeat-containing protein [Streptomyces sp. ISL-43]MBT2447826.1 VCBS repeat-containing protein [Streptomyces sp. ISL-43]